MEIIVKEGDRVWGEPPYIRIEIESGGEVFAVYNYYIAFKRDRLVVISVYENDVDIVEEVYEAKSIEELIQRVANDIKDELDTADRVNVLYSRIDVDENEIRDAILKVAPKTTE